MIYISTVKTLPEIPELNEEDSLFFRQSTTPEAFRAWVNAVIFIFPGYGYTALLLSPNVH